MPSVEPETPQSPSEGTTLSERYLARLAKRSFLSLWSYANVYTDEGRRGGKGDGKELCDLLVVFGDDVLIFSDKHCDFPNTGQTALAWARWYRRAVQKSARQVVGARNWITRFPSRLYLDRACHDCFPIALPSPSELRFHLVAVTSGAYEACRYHFQGHSTGSLVVNTSVRGPDHERHPFTIGRVIPLGPYIHVLDEVTLNVVLREMDTVKDLVAYLERKELLLTHPTRNVLATGEEQLVAWYLTKLDDSGNHNFTGLPEDVDIVFIDEGHWEEFIRSPQYLAKKSADKPSYAWDHLIEHLTFRGEVGLGEDARRNLYEMEPALRALASESRLARRQLAQQLLEAIQKEVPPGQRFLRMGHTRQSPETAYVFLILPHPPFVKTYAEYREGRRAMLLASCKVARLRAPSAHKIVGIATEPAGTGGASEDLVWLDVHDEPWGAEEQDEAQNLQREAGILLDENVLVHEKHDNEYPEPSIVPLFGSPSSRLLERKRLENFERLAKKQIRKKSKQGPPQPPGDG